MSHLVKVTFQGPWTNYRTPKYKFASGTSYVMPAEEAEFFHGFPGFFLEAVDARGFNRGDNDMHPYAEPPSDVNYPRPEQFYDSGGEE